MHWGPFTFTGEISLGAVLQFATVVFVCVKYLNTYFNDLKRSSERATQLWVKFNGEHEDDPKAWFHRLEEMERKINTVWGKLAFNRIIVDESKTRASDV